jgi:MFS family permease
VRLPQALAPFRVRSFRYQWPSHLAASWAFEMEIIILGWYVLVETGSVLLLSAFGSMVWAGTLVAPLFGVAGDRIGHRNLLCLVRTFYLAQALVLLALAWSGLLSPLYVFIVSGAMSMVRPSDSVMRYALIGETVPGAGLLAAMSIERTTPDSARVVGALTGAGMIAAFGMAPAYAVICAFYALSLALTLAIRVAPAAGAASPPLHRVEPSPSTPPHPVKPSPLHELLAAFGYVRRTPLLLAAMCLSFLVNFTAYPLTLGLLPYVAKDIYHTDQTGLGYLAASFSLGGLLGSIAVAHRGTRILAGRWMLLAAAAWYVALAVFAHTHGMVAGICMLLLAGCMQSLSLLPMSAVLLQHSAPEYRGRVMGIRMFTIYGLTIGLLIAGPLVATLGFAAMATIYCGVGLVSTGAIALRWQTYVWERDAPANMR